MSNSISTWKILWSAWLTRAVILTISKVKYLILDQMNNHDYLFIFIYMCVWIKLVFVAYPLIQAFGRLSFTVSLSLDWTNRYKLLQVLKSVYRRFQTTLHYRSYRTKHLGVNVYRLNQFKVSEIHNSSIEN